VAGGVVGGLLSSTGIGAAVGVPAIAVSTVVVVGGAANVMAGLAWLMSSGSGSSTPRHPSEGAAPAAREGAALSKEAQRSIRSSERPIAEDEGKLAEFKANPTVRPGTGMEGLPRELIQKQQQTRIEHLEHEIQVFRQNIEKRKPRYRAPASRSRSQPQALPPSQPFWRSEMPLGLSRVAPPRPWKTSQPRLAHAAG
jgi:hypothetical protein